MLVVGHHKRWRDEASAQVHHAGFQATVCDRGVDAMTVLALGLPVDVLVIDAALQGSLCCSRLAIEARALRPNLRIVFAGDDSDEGIDDLIPDSLTVERDRLSGIEMVGTVREVLADRFS
ncbi:histidine kinase [Methylobacterium sp. J-076]|uniref:histidine kinase n=1 Tax=Methylobacterium sp. J-076 TaxID=2836655 RepID=UPI0028C50C22|nr:histidine kinase [Methylobacterium sp. J-076]